MLQIGVESTRMTRYFLSKNKVNKGNICEANSTIRLKPEKNINKLD